MIIKSMFLLGMLLTAANAPINVASKAKINAIENIACEPQPSDNEAEIKDQAPWDDGSTWEDDEVSDGFRPYIGDRLINCGIGGRFTFINDQGVQVPMIGTKVEIYRISTNDEGVDEEILCDSIYLDNDGQFVISKPRRIKPVAVRYFLKIIAAGNATNVVDENGNQYEYRTPVKSFFAAMVNFSEIFTMDTKIGRAFSTNQGGIMAASFVEHLNNDTPITNCTIHYPGNSEGSYYNRANNLYLGTRATASGCPNIYASWDTIGHEYGHHVQKVFKIEANPGGTHYTGSNAADDAYSTKGPSRARSEGTKLAYAEGWASAYSLLAQKYQEDAYPSMFTFADSSYTAYNGVNKDYATYPVRKGEAAEESVTALMYNLCDVDDENDPYENLSISYEEFWDISTRNNPKDFSSFMGNVYYASSLDFDDVAPMLEVLQMAPTGVTHNNKWFTNIGPTFMWTAQGGSRYFYNNKFRFQIFDEDGQDWYDDYAEITSDGKTGAIKIEDDIWEYMIEEMPGNKIYIRVGGIADYYNYTTGEYFSKMVEFDKPTQVGQEERHITVSPNEWGFKEQYFFTTNATGTNKETELDKGGYLIFTDRIRCATIDRTYVVLSPKRQNAGSAYFQLTFDDSVNSVNFETALWSSSEGINKNNSTIKVYTMDINGNWNENIDLWNDVTLPVKENGLMDIQTPNANPIWGIKIAMTSPATGTKNAGRLALGNITLNY